ncbi:unnamed protein product [Malus baccata var. baccata]
METTYVPNTVFPGPTPISVHTYSIRKTSKEASQANKISHVEDLSPTLKADHCLIHFCNVLISLVTVKRKGPKTSKVCKSKRLQRDKNNLRPPHPGRKYHSSNTFLTRLAKMKTLQSFVLLLFFTICHNVTTGVYSQCLKDQQLSLLRLKKNLTFDDLGSLVSSQFVSWDSSADCCSWIGVTCSSNGRVVGLDISIQNISGGIDSSSSLFDLQHLLTLNLADNSFVEGIPSAIGKLTNLRYLDLSGNHYFEKIPFEISRLTRLEVLDISQSDCNGDCKPLESPKFSMLFRNLSNLTVLNLDRNNISAPVPGFFANFSKLTTLSLADCGLRGTFPKQIFQVPTLQTIDLSSNTALHGYCTTIGNLNLLSTLGLSGCNFTGSIPKPIGNLTKLVDLDLSSNMFNGPISSIHWENLIYLEGLELDNNQLVGSIPSSLVSLPLLPVLHLSHNNFTGRVPEIFNVSSSFVTSIDLSFNHLEGPVPKSIFNIRGLETLTLSSNNFSAFPFNCPQLPNLMEIDLSHNSLRTFPVFLSNQTYVTYLDLSENQIQGQLPNWIWKLDSLDYLNVSYNALESLEGPFINPASPVSMLDLHSNQLKGPILIVPPDAEYLDYSNNHFSSGIPVSICNARRLLALDLSSNSLSGEIPQCLAAMSRLVILKVKKNNITGMISNLAFPESLEALDLSQNQIEGQFPKSLARCTSLIFLNLAENQITDTFPCLLKNISDLRILALRSNNFYGGIGCPVVKTNATWQALQIVDLAYNNFNGEVPGFSLTTWQAMKGNIDNSDSIYITLSFQGLGHISFFTRAALNPYKPAYRGPAMFTFSYEPAITITSKGLKRDLAKIITVLTLIDFSCNNFIGSIPKEMGALKSLYFLNLSNNAFTGEIPSSFGNMRQLESLDLSHNKLSGQIPQQLANLSFLEFLNLSNNQLVGKIPAGTQISTFPRDSFTGNKGLWGPPLTVDNKAGPCKIVQDRRGENLHPQSPPSTLNGSHPNSTDEIDWDLINVEIGFAFDFVVAVGSLVFFKRWSKWYYRSMYKILVKIFPQLEERIGPHRRHVHINQRWRR